MKKLPLVLAVLIGLVDAALAAGIAFILIEPESGGKAGGAETLIAEDFEDNSRTYQELSRSASYSSIIRANAGTDAQGGSSAKYEPTPTLAPTPSVTSPGNSSETVPGMPDSDFVFPQSSTRLLTQEEMNRKLTTKETAQRAINEIYARHGYLFHQDKNAENYAYFNSKSWYVKLPKIDSQEEVRRQFSEIENANVDALIAFQNARNWG